MRTLSVFLYELHDEPFLCFWGLCCVICSTCEFQIQLHSISARNINCSAVARNAVFSLLASIDIVLWEMIHQETGQQTVWTESLKVLLRFLSSLLQCDPRCCLNGWPALWGAGGSRSWHMFQCVFVSPTSHLRFFQTWQYTSNREKTACMW